MCYLKSPTIAFVWYQTMTMSLHQFQTLFLIYPIKGEWWSLTFISYLKCRQSIFELTPWWHLLFTWNSSAGSCQCSTLCWLKTLLWVDLSAVNSRACCRNILTPSSSFNSFKVDSVESIFGGFLGHNSRNLFIRQCWKYTQLYFKLLFSSSCVPSSVKLPQIHLWNRRLCAKPHSIRPEEIINSQI